MVIKNKTLERYKNKFLKLEQNNFKIMNLDEDEKVRHCIQFKEENCYNPCWVVTNKGRVWSLAWSCWMSHRFENGYWRVANAYVHKYVDFYFMNEEEKQTKKLLDNYNKNCSEKEKQKYEIHHKETIKIVNDKLMSPEEKMRECMKVNYKENLVYQIKGDHKNAHRIMKGDLPIDLKGEKVEVDNTTRNFIGIHPNNVYYSYNEGKSIINMAWSGKGMTPEEIEWYEKNKVNKQDVMF